MFNAHTCEHSYMETILTVVKYLPPTFHKKSNRAKAPNPNIPPRILKPMHSYATAWNALSKLKTFVTITKILHFIYNSVLCLPSHSIMKMKIFARYKCFCCMVTVVWMVVVIIPSFVRPLSLRFNEIEQIKMILHKCFRCQ